MQIHTVLLSLLVYPNQMVLLLYYTRDLFRAWRNTCRDYFLAVPKSVIRSQETWHNSLAVTILRLNQLYRMLTWDKAAEKYSKWFWFFVKFLCFSRIWTRHLRRREAFGHTTLAYGHFWRNHTTLSTSTKKISRVWVRSIFLF